jgi:uncharacterized membrane protein YhfC
MVRLDVPETQFDYCIFFFFLKRKKKNNTTELCFCSTHTGVVFVLLCVWFLFPLYLFAS